MFAVALWDAGTQPHWPSERGVGGPVPQMRLLGVGVQTCSSGGSWELCVPSSLCRAALLGGFMGVCLRLSHHFGGSVFSFARCVVGAQLISGFPSKGTVPRVAIDFVCLRGRCVPRAPRSPAWIRTGTLTDLKRTDQVFCRMFLTLGVSACFSWLDGLWVWGKSITEVKFSSHEDSHVVHIAYSLSWSLGSRRVDQVYSL